MVAIPTNLPSPNNPSALDTWIAQRGLQDIYHNFLIVTEGPEDGKCLILVCERIKRTLDKLSFWSGIEPFKDWPQLVNEVVAQAAWLEKNVGVHMRLDRPQPRAGVYSYEKNPMYGEINKYPIYAMLCDQHEQNSDLLRLEYS